jgi:hypothetical protein
MCKQTFTSTNLQMDKEMMEIISDLVEWRLSLCGTGHAGKLFRGCMLRRARLLVAPSSNRKGPTGTLVGLQGQIAGPVHCCGLYSLPVLHSR